MPQTFAPTDPPPSFAYAATAADGRAVRGTLEAATESAAHDQLASLGLAVRSIAPAAPPRKAFSPDDFLAFNQQLARLAGNGLPIERGLRLMAAEMAGAKQRAAVSAVAEQLERGVPLGRAFAAAGAAFPPLYGRVLDAGVRANNVAGVLLNLGRHVRVVRRLRAAVWRASVYPVLVLATLLLVMAFLWGYVIPHATVVFTSKHTLFDGMQRKAAGGPPPADPTAAILAVVKVASYALMAGIALVLTGVAAAVFAGGSAAGRRWREPVLVRLPLVGPVVRANRVARWCDAVAVAASAGLDLPAALGVAADAVDSDALRADSAALTDAVAAGRPIDDPAEHLRLLPPLVPATLAHGAAQHDLPAAADGLARTYAEQTELRLTALPQVLSPLLLLLTAACVGLAIVAALMPLLATLRNLTELVMPR